MDKDTKEMFQLLLSEFGKVHSKLDNLTTDVATLKTDMVEVKSDIVDIKQTIKENHAEMQDSIEEVQNDTAYLTVKKANAKILTDKKTS